MTDTGSTVVITGASSGFGAAAVRAFAAMDATSGASVAEGFTQPRQDALLTEMQHDTVLGGADTRPLPRRPSDPRPTNP